VDGTHKFLVTLLENVDLEDQEGNDRIILRWNIDCEDWRWMELDL
jgi:hypothetical protein